MCFNAPVSAFTYIIGLIGSYLLYKHDYIPEAIFYFWIIQMQLIEFVIWLTIYKYNMPNASNALNIQDSTSYVCLHPFVNRVMTKLGIFINHTEPIVLWISILLFSTLKLSWNVNYIMILYVIVTLYYIHHIPLHKKENTLVTQQSYPHLHWKWNYGNNSMTYYIFFLSTIVILSIYGLKNGYMHATIAVISFIISSLIYRDSHSIGTMWCFFGAFIPYILILLYRN